MGKKESYTGDSAEIERYDHMGVRVNDNSDFFGHLRPVCVQSSAVNVRHLQPVYVWPRAAGLCLATYGRFMFGHLWPVNVGPVRLDKLQELCQRG